MRNVEEAPPYRRGAGRTTRPTPLYSTFRVRHSTFHILGTVYCNVKFTVTVITIATGVPFSSVGVNSHCLTASSAA
jgi:hypothetical protein